MNKYAVIIDCTEYLSGGYDPYSPISMREYKEFKSFKDNNELLLWLNDNHNKVNYTIISFDEVEITPTFQVK